MEKKTGSPDSSIKGKTTVFEPTKKMRDQSAVSDRDPGKKNETKRSQTKRSEAKWNRTKRKKKNEKKTGGKRRENACFFPWSGPRRDQNFLPVGIYKPPNLTCGHISQLLIRQILYLTSGNASHGVTTVSMALVPVKNMPKSYA